MRIGIKPVIEKVDTSLPLGVNSIEDFASADAEDAIAAAEEILFEDSSDSYSPRELLQERIDSLQERWMEYELDPIKALDFPLMLDPSCDQTYAFISAMEEVKRVQRRLDLKEVKLPKLTKAVKVAERAFAAAEANAKKQRLTYLSNDDRKKVAKARKFAEIMNDSGSGTNEKRIAFDRANKALEGVLPPLTPKIIGMIES